MKTILPLCLVAALACGCAVVGEEGRHLTNVLDENLSPESTPAKVMLAPVAIPVGFTALVVDGVVINPVVNLPEAFEDAYAVFDDVPFTGPFEIVVFPMRIVTFGVIFVGSEVARCMIPGM